MRSYLVLALTALTGIASLISTSDASAATKGAQADWASVTSGSIFAPDDFPIETDPDPTGGTAVCTGAEVCAYVKAKCASAGGSYGQWTDADGNVTGTCVY